ncbi:hypothetical protein IFM89_029040 [Coptis chinensis]|uniref:Cytochrome P450 n=1 Tax=Coptis chinensis TaxID=261450 RepID=A0A835IFY6_9MAGN|nr:hypothetical protein IFM89_029040 [Coptis chinensis]
MDEKIFEEPEKFDPSRFGNPSKSAPPYTYIPFGAGPRACPGVDFARIEMMLILHHLIINYKWTELIPDEAITREPMPYPAMGLPIKLHPRKDMELEEKPAILANSSDADNVGSDDIVSFEGIESREKISEKTEREIKNGQPDTLVVAELEEKDSRNLHVPDASVNIDEGYSSQDVVKEPEVLEIQDKQKKEESPSIRELRDYGLNRNPEILP